MIYSVKTNTMKWIIKDLTIFGNNTAGIDERYDKYIITLKTIYIVMDDNIPGLLIFSRTVIKNCLASLRLQPGGNRLAPPNRGNRLALTRL